MHSCTFWYLTALCKAHISWDLRAKRVLSLYKVYGDSALLALNWTSLNSDSALLVLNWTSLNSDSALLVLNWTSLNSDSALLVLNWTSLNSDSALLVLNWTSLNSDSALLAPNWRYANTVCNMHLQAGVELWWYISEPSKFCLFLKIFVTVPFFREYVCVCVQNRGIMWPSWSLVENFCFFWFWYIYVSDYFVV